MRSVRQSAVFLIPAARLFLKIPQPAHRRCDEGSPGGCTSAGDLAFDRFGTLVMTTTSNPLVAVNTGSAGISLVGNAGADQVLGLA